MVVVYPVILKEDDGEYVVRIPDFHTVTEGKDLADAIYMARDAIGLLGIDYEDDGKELPVPNGTEYNIEEGERITLVDVNLTEYRKRHDNRMVKKNCTIPYYLNIEAEKQGINFSRVLQEALITKMNMN